MWYSKTILAGIEDAIEALKTKGEPARVVMSFRARAMSQAKASDSKAHGPRMKNGSPLPTRMF